MGLKNLCSCSVKEMMRFGTMDTTSLRLGRKEQGGLPRVSPLGLRAQARELITEAVEKIIIESDLINRASRDRVWVGYNPN
jgi:hypothetical protein